VLKIYTWAIRYTRKIYKLFLHILLGMPCEKDTLLAFTFPKCFLGISCNFDNNMDIIDRNCYFISVINAKKELFK